MNSTIISHMSFLNQEKNLTNFNLPLLIAVIAILLIALYICVRITRRNRLYIHHKRKPRAKVTA